MNQEVLRLIDSIAREKNIDREVVFQGIEGALLSAARKQYGQTAEIQATVDRISGQMVVAIDGAPVEPRNLGRIAAQAAKQVIIQKNREAERMSIQEEFSGRKGSIVSGQVTRIEGPNLIINLGRAEGFLPRSEQIPGEIIHEADRARALVLDVRESGSQVKIILSRTHADFVRRLFELEVPEVTDKIIDIRAIAREPGQRTKIAVSSIDSRVDAVGACVGVRGARIKNIVEELGGEKIDIVRFNESSQVFIANALRPAEVEDIFLNPVVGRATVIVREDQLSLAIGKRGQNVRLAARLTGWDLDIMLATEFAEQRANAVRVLTEIPGVTPETAERIAGAGFVSFRDLAELEPQVLTRFEGVTEELAANIIAFIGEYLKQIEAAKDVDTPAAATGEQGQEAPTEAGTESASEAGEPAGDGAAGSEVAGEEEQLPAAKAGEESTPASETGEAAEETESGQGE